MIPDWDAKPAAVPYANFGNPQSLNLYAYVGNNPSTDGDPNGHCDWCRRAWNYVTSLFASKPQPSASVTVEEKDELPREQQDQIIQQIQNVEITIGTLGIMSSAEVPVGDTTVDETPEVSTGAVATGADAGTITRYMGAAEADTAASSEEIPATDREGNPKLVYVTTDPPVDSATEAKQKYDLPNTPTHRATVPADRASLQPAPNGPKTSGGTQAVSAKPIPVKKTEITPLHPDD